VATFGFLAIDFVALQYRMAALDGLLLPNFPASPDRNPLKSARPIVT
jgi:hypothetical protein